MADIFGDIDSALKQLPDEAPKGGLFGDIDHALDPRPQKFKDQDAKLDAARTWAGSKLASEGDIGSQTLGGVGVSVRDIAENAIPGVSAYVKVAKGRHYQDAIEAYKKGDASDEQLGHIAEYELQQNRQRSMGVGRSALQTAIGLPALVGETALTGPVAGLAGKSILGSEAAATIAGKAAQGALTPALTAPAAQQRAEEQGGDWWDAKNIAPAAGMAAIKNVILGTVGGQVGKANANLPSRAVAAAALGITENQVGDAFLSTLDNVLPDAYQTKTKWGTIGHALRGEQGEAWKALASDAVAFGVFGALHGREANPVETLAKASDALTAAGVSPEKQPAIIQDAVRNPDTVGEGPLKDLVQEQAKATDPLQGLSDKEIAKSAKQIGMPVEEFKAFVRKQGFKPEAPESSQTTPEPPGVPEAAGQEKGPQARPQEAGPVSEAVRAAFGDRAEDLGQGMYSVTHGDRFLAVSPDGEGRVSVNFASNEHIPGRGTGAETTAKIPLGMRSGTKAIFDDLRSVARELGSRGIDISYTASPAKGEGGRSSRADVYERALIKAGYEKVQEGSSDKPFVWIPKEKAQLLRGEHPELRKEADAADQLLRAGQDPRAVEEAILRERQGGGTPSQVSPPAPEGAGRPPAEGGRPADPQGPPPGPAQAGPAPVPGTEGRAGEQTGVDEQAAKLLADAQAGQVLTQGLGTAMPANFTPAQAKQIGESFRERAGNFFRTLMGQTAPAISKESAASGNAVGHFAASRNFANELTPEMIDRILPDERAQSQRLTFGAVLTEMRLRFMRWAYLNESAKEAANGNVELAKEHQDAAAKVKSVVGQPIDGDVLKNPLGSEADYQRYLQDQEVKAFLDRWKQHVEPFLDEMYRTAQGLDPTDHIPSFTQMPDLKMNLFRWQPGSEGKDVVNLGGGEKGTVGGIGRQFANRFGFAKKASGAGEGYHLDITDILSHSIDGGYSNATKNAMFRQLAQDGVIQFAKPGRKNAPEGYDHELPGVIPPGGTDYAKPGETSAWLKSEGTAGELYKALNIGMKLNRIPLTGFFNWYALRSLSEATYHTGNLMKMMLVPGMRFRDVARNAAGIVRGDRQIQDRILELAKIGATKPKGMESQMEGGTILGKLDPGKYTSKFLDLVDRAVRLSGEQAFARKTDLKKGTAKYEAGLRDFLNQSGNYNLKTQSRLVSFFRQTGIGPFATAGSTFYIQGIKSLLGAHGIKTESRALNYKIQAEMIGRAVAVLASGLVANKLINNRWDGDDNTPFGAIKLGTKDGKTVSFDLANLFGITRGLRETGVKAVIEGLRPAARAKGATAGSIADKATDDIVESLLRPFEGPFVSAAYTAKTGKDLLGRQIAAVPSTATTSAGQAKAAGLGKPKAGESQEKYNLIAAGIHSNSVAASVANALGLDPANPKSTLGEEAIRQLGPFGVKFTKEPPGTPHRTITVPVKSK